MGKEKELIIHEQVYLDLEEQLNFFVENSSFAYAIRFANEFVERVNKIAIYYDTYYYAGCMGDINIKESLAGNDYDTFYVA